MIDELSISVPGLGSTRTVSVKVPDVCPICKKNISPQRKFASAIGDAEKGVRAIGIYYCSGCNYVFLCTYDVVIEESAHMGTHAVIYDTDGTVEPIKHAERIFDDALNKVSERFSKIYNDSLAAEEYGLDEIAGMGYRKALEFLIKDYLVYDDPVNADSIKAMNLSKCIKDKVPVTNLKIVAERCAWIGNDFAHYVPLHDDKDIDDLKALLESSIYWVLMELKAKEAADEIQHKGRPQKEVAPPDPSTE